MPPASRRPAAAPAEPAETPQPPVAPPPHATPVFGHLDSWGGTHDFELEMFDDELGEVVVETFTAYEQPGGGAVLAFMRASSNRREDPTAASGAAAALIYRALVDNDGLPSTYEPPRNATGTILTDHPDYDERFDNPDDHSSRRRFAAIIESETIRVAPDVVDTLGKWLAEGSVGRPTDSPSQPSRGGKRTARGAGRRR